MTHDVEIIKDGNRSGTHLLIDGMDIANYTKSVKVRIDDVSYPEIVISLITPSILVKNPNCSVNIRDDERDLLISLGWTPPNA